MKEINYTHLNEEQKERLKPYEIQNLKLGDNYFHILTQNQLFFQRFQNPRLLSRLPVTV